MDAEDGRAADLAFARYYAIHSNVFCLAATGILLSSLTAEENGVAAEAVGKTIVSPWALVILAVFEVTKVIISKRLSSHPGVFSLPPSSNPVRGDPTKGPLLRRIVLRGGIHQSLLRLDS
jgi:hypothetical protein